MRGKLFDSVLSTCGSLTMRKPSVLCRRKHVWSWNTPSSQLSTFNWWRKEITLLQRLLFGTLLMVSKSSQLHVVSV